MRAVLLVIALLLLLSGCSWKEFNDDVQKVVDSLSFLGEGISNKTKESVPVPGVTVKECADDACILDALKDCTPAHGTFSWNGSAGEILINALPESCVLDWQVAQGTVSKTSITCAFSKEGVSSFPDLIDPDSGACDGTWYGDITPHVSIVGPITIPAVELQKSQFAFNLTPDKTLYLQSVVVTGPRFRNCSLTYKNPVKLQRGAENLITLECSVKGTSSHASGVLEIRYYEKPDFKDVAVAKGSFFT